MAEDAPPKGVSEVGEFLASIAPAIPDKARTELIRLLSHSVAAPTSQELREARLGLLTEMVGEGWIPGVDDYESERGRRVEEGEDWPSRASLTEHHGTWASAVEAAFDLAFSITPRRSRTRTRQAWPTVPYSRPEIQFALRRSSEKVGRTISQWEYAELRRVERQLAVRLGLPDPRLPQMNVIKRSFGGWDQAMSKVECGADHGQPCCGSFEAVRRRTDSRAGFGRREAPDMDLGRVRIWDP